MYVVKKWFIILSIFFITCARLKTWIVLLLPLPCTDCWFRLWECMVVTQALFLCCLIICCTVIQNQWSPLEIQPFLCTKNVRFFSVAQFWVISSTEALKPVCCKKWQKIVPDQLLVWGIRALLIFWVVSN